MSATALLAALRRRWYVLLFALVCTVAALWVVHERPIGYEGCEALYLAGPPAAGNVYLDGNPSLAMTTGMLTVTMTSPSMRQRLRASGLTTGYTVMQTNTGEIRFPAYTLPTLQVCSASRTPQQVLLALSTVVDESRAVLYDMQSRLRTRPKSFITADTLTPASASPVLGRPSQAYLGVILMGLIGGLALTLWFDSILSRWNRPSRRTCSEVST